MPELYRGLRRSCQSHGIRPMGWQFGSNKEVSDLWPHMIFEFRESVLSSKIILVGKKILLLVFQLSVHIYMYIHRIFWIYNIMSKDTRRNECFKLSIEGSIALCVVSVQFFLQVEVLKALKHASISWYDIYLHSGTYCSIK